MIKNDKAHYHNFTNDQVVFLSGSPLEILVNQFQFVPDENEEDPVEQQNEDQDEEEEEPVEKKEKKKKARDNISLLSDFFCPDSTLFQQLLSDVYCRGIPHSILSRTITHRQIRSSGRQGQSWPVLLSGWDLTL